MDNNQINRLRKLIDEIQAIVDEGAKRQQPVYYESIPYMPDSTMPYYRPEYLYPFINPQCTQINCGLRSRTNQPLVTNGYKAAY